MAPDRPPSRSEAPDAEGMSEGWLVVPTHGVPAAWRDRAEPALLIRLLPAEMADILAGDTPVAPALDPHDLALARLIARGLSTAKIARELGVSTRTVQRRVARLQRLLDVPDRSALQTTLARAGID